MRSTTRLRQLLREHEFLTAPTVYDPLSALLAQEAGFPLCYIGGYVVGAHLGCGEPLLSSTEMIDTSARIGAAVTIPTIADAGAGFGNLPHTVRTIRGFEQAGTAGVHLEDQVVPKRVGYHRGEVHIIPRDDMRHKVRLVLELREDPDFVIIARTDARGAVGGGLDETLARLDMFMELGADLILAFPANPEEAVLFAEKAPGKMIYVSPEGRSSRPNLDANILRDIGYRMVVYSEGSLLRSASTLRSYFRDLRTSSITAPADEAFYAAERAAVEGTLNIQDSFALEDLEPI